MNNNYVDARTPEERANEPESYVTTATALNKDTLKKRVADILGLELQEDEYRLIVTDDMDNPIEYSDWTDEVNELTALIQQAKEERDTEWKKAINSSALYHLEYDKASAFASDVLLILNTK